MKHVYTVIQIEVQSVQQMISQAGKSQDRQKLGKLDQIPRRCSFFLWLPWRSAAQVLTRLYIYLVSTILRLFTLLMKQLEKKLEIANNLGYFSMIMHQLIFHHMYKCCSKNNAVIMPHPSYLAALGISKNPQKPDIIKDIKTAYCWISPRP